MTKSSWTYVDGDSVASYLDVNDNDIKEIKRLFKGLGIVTARASVSGALALNVCSPGGIRYEVEL
jgi:hypothetical protein